MRDIMCHNLIIKDINSSIYEICDAMKKYDIGFIPIADNNKIVGVITDRDIVVKILSNNDNKIKGYLSSPISIDINKSLDDVLELMKKHKIKRLLVSDNNKLVGVISLSDLLGKIDTNEVISEIFEINRNNDTYITKINEFYL